MGHPDRPLKADTDTPRLSDTLHQEPVDTGPVTSRR